MNYILTWISSLILFMYGIMHPSFSQSHKISLRDSSDNKLDLSDWVLTANGFIPVPTLITEPAVGGFGGGLFAVFIKPNTPYIDSIHGQVVKTRAKPNVYGIGGAYTINGTWAVGAATAGVIKKWRSNYRIIGAYADANLTFYKQFKDREEQTFDLNMRTVPLFGQLIKQFGTSNWYAGVNYLWLKTELTRTNYEFHEPEDEETLISRPGLLVEYDKRDNVITPGKGLRWNTLFSSSVKWLGSEYSYNAINTALYAWIPVSTKLYSGFRTEYQQVWGDAPFFMLPFINMRGIPLARYQGRKMVLAETEWRWDFAGRWSAVGFGGTGKAVQQEYTFSESAWHWAGGVGGRYLLARKMKLRAGIDVARGPESWAYYIVLGSYWIR